MPAILTRSALVLLFVLSQPAWAALALHLEVDVHTEARPNAKVPPDSKQKLELALAGDSMTVAEGGAVALYDFKARRRYALDPAAKTYVAYSLYAAPAFRMFELGNRQGISRMLAAGGMAQTPTLQNEHQLSILAGGGAAPAAIEERVDGGQVVLSSEGVELARWSSEGVLASPAELAEFTRYLRHGQGGHPRVLERIAAGQAVPGRLVLTFHQFSGVTTRTLAVSRADGAPPPPTLAGYQRRQASADALDALLDRMDALTPPQLDALRAAPPCTAPYRAGEALDSVLERLECALALGVPLPRHTAVEQAALQQQEAVQRLFRAVRAKTKDEKGAAVADLEQLRPLAPRRAYVLKLFEANHRVALGQRDQARKLLLDVLEANPALSGAYKDLGDLLLMGFDMDRAWRCFDTGRRIAPGNSMYTPVNALEAQLLKTYPGFF